MTKSEQDQRPEPMARPRPERLVQGEAQPERPVNSTRTEDTPDQEGIEIDHASDRPAD